MLTAGALVLGGTKLPWGTLAGPAGVDITDCLTVSASPDISFVGAGVSVTQNERGVTFVSDTGATETVRFADGEARVNSSDGSSSSLRKHDSGEYALPLSDGTIVTFVAWEDPNDPSKPLVEVWSVESNSESTRVTGPAPLSSPTPSASASADCVSPSPVASASASPSPSPSALDLPEQQIDLEGSPFTVGFAFPFDEYGTDQLYIEDPVWLTPDEANAAMRSMYQVPSDAPQAAGTDLVARVTIADSLGGQADFTGGVGGARDPELMLDGGASQASHSNPGAYFVQGASFVAVRDGVVVGTLAVVEDPQPFPAMNYDIALDRQNVDPSRDMWATLLNPEGAFVDVGGQTLTGEYDLYAVAGSGIYDAQGVYSGTFYTWKKLERQ